MSFSEDNRIQHCLESIPDYEMNDLACGLIREKADEWGLEPQQVEQLCSASAQELALLGQTIRKLWKWPQFVPQTEEREDLGLRLAALDREMEAAETEAEKSKKQAAVEELREQLWPALTVERDQEDAVAQMVTEVHHWTHTAAKKNALYKFLAASSTYVQSRNEQSTPDFERVLAELKQHAQEHPLVISDNGQTFETQALLTLLV